MTYVWLPLWGRGCVAPDIVRLRPCWWPSLWSSTRSWCRGLWRCGSGRSLQTWQACRSSWRLRGAPGCNRQSGCHRHPLGLPSWSCRSSWWCHWRWCLYTDQGVLRESKNVSEDNNFTKWDSSIDNHWWKIPWKKTTFGVVYKRTSLLDCTSLTTYNTAQCYIS